MVALVPEGRAETLDKGYKLALTDRAYHGVSSVSQAIAGSENRCSCECEC